jgi:hypothetical protein
MKDKKEKLEMNGLAIEKLNANYNPKYFRY